VRAEHDTGTKMYQEDIVYW